MTTGPNEVAALNEVDFFPYSDFLVHDMGSLNDGIAQPPATSQQMRTAPLWGARIRTSFLHDGRARTIRDAILAHDGQGKAARDNFANLDERRKGQGPGVHQHPVGCGDAGMTTDARAASAHRCRSLVD